MIWLILFSLPCIFLVYHFITLKWVNPYKLVFVFGKKGSGKSTILTKVAYQNLKNNVPVYSTEDMTFTFKKESRSTIPVNPHEIYNYNFEPGSVILIDEVSLIWDNRNFKNMDPRVVEWFRYQRHYKVKVFLFSQSFDIDKKLRDLSDDMFLVNKFLRVFTIARHMVRKPVIVHPSEDSPARIDDDIIQDGLLLAPFGGCKIAFIPRWAKSFDSFKSPSLSSPSPSSDNKPIRKYRHSQYS